MPRPKPADCYQIFLKRFETCPLLPNVTVFLQEEVRDASFRHSDLHFLILELLVLYQLQDMSHIGLANGHIA